MRDSDGAPVAGARVSIQGGGAESSIVVSADQPALEGLRVPQVPRNQGSLGLRYVDPAGLIVRASGPQYDDDLNLFPLGRATIVDLLVGRNVGRGLELYAAAENLLDDRYDIARTPVLSLGLPRTLRAGVRIQASSFRRP